MSLQDIFYIVGIIFMSLLILVFITFLILIFYLRKRASKLLDLVEGKIITAQNIIFDSKRIFGLLSKGIFPFILNQLARKIKKRTNSSK